MSSRHPPGIAQKKFILWPLSPVLAALAVRSQNASVRRGFDIAFSWVEEQTRGAHAGCVSKTMGIII